MIKSLTNKDKYSIQEIQEMRINDEIIAIIKTSMKEQNMSLGELAHRIGVVKSAVSRYLNSTREFPLNRAEGFTKVLGIKTEYLSGLAERGESTKQNTVAAHLDGDFTEEELIEVREYAKLVRKAHRDQ